jgi:hypothetical protein
MNYQASATSSRAHHDPPVHGHPGINRTTQIVERNYWWPQLRQDVKDYVQGCADCQRHKVNNRPTKAPLRPIYPKPEAMPFETIALDFITKLPESQGYDSILTVTDHDCTKAAIFIPCREEINAEGTAALYIKHVFAHFGLPRKGHQRSRPSIHIKIHARSMPYHRDRAKPIYGLPSSDGWTVRAL